MNGIIFYNDMVCLKRGYALSPNLPYGIITYRYVRHAIASRTQTRRPAIGTLFKFIDE